MQNHVHSTFLNLPLVPIISFLEMILTLVLLNPDLSVFENSVDPDQLASDEASWLGSTLFSTLLVNICL